MKVILVFVSTLDGRITKGKDPEVTHWSSKEDQELFTKIRENTKLIVMGRNTYEAAKPRIKLSLKTFRIVLTHTPEKNIPGQLEFTDESPIKLVNRLKKKFKEMLLVGGSEIATQFFKEKLIDEVWLTIEPKIFGRGIPIVADEPLNVSLELFGFNKLNSRGTLHLRYKVVSIS